MEVLLDLSETAAVFSVSKKTIRVWYARGAFPKPVRVGNKLLRWRKSELVAYVEGGCKSISNLENENAN